MSRTILSATLLCGMLLPAASAGEPPRLTIVMDGKPITGPIKLWNGQVTRFHAVKTADATETFDRSSAVRMVRWRLRRVQGMADAKPSSPGVLVSDRTVWWKETWGFFASPYDLRPPSTPGRYVLSVDHAKWGRAQVAITVGVLRLIVHRSERTRDSYDAAFTLSIVDPDLTGPFTLVDVASLGPSGRVVDRAQEIRLARREREYRRFGIILSSRPPQNEDATPTLRVVPGGALEILASGHAVRLPVPLSGSLVYNKVKPSVGLVPAARPPGEPPALTASPSGPIQIVTSAGRRRRVKIWVGWPTTFAARLRDPGVEGMFAPTEWLEDVTWSLTHHLPPRPHPEAIISGRKPPRARRWTPRPRFWGDPAPTFTLRPRRADAEVGGYRLLRAERPDGAADTIRIDTASLDFAEYEVPLLKEEIRRKRYSASLRLRLVDANESRHRIPVQVRIIDRQARMLDERRGIVLRRVHGFPHTFLSQTLFLASEVSAPCKARYRRRKPFDPSSTEPPPPRPTVLPVLEVSLGCRLRIVLDGTRFDFPVPP